MRLSAPTLIGHAYLTVFPKTENVVEKGPACRVSGKQSLTKRVIDQQRAQIYGSMDVKKVTGNLHVVRTCHRAWCQRLLLIRHLQTTLGHGYLSWEHTDHACKLEQRVHYDDIKLIPWYPVMNLSHVIHEFSFGPYFPRIIQPLDDSVYVSRTITNNSR